MLNDTVKVRVRCDCTICDGTGWIKDRRECLSCEGLGTHDEGRDGPELLSVLHQVLSAYERRSGVATEMRVRLEEEVACGHCNGTGDSFPAPGTCSFCNGSGMLWQEV